MLSASAKNKIMTARLKAELELAWNATSEAEALAEARAHALAAAEKRIHILEGGLAEARDDRETLEATARDVLQLKRALEDERRQQTVFARRAGEAAAHSDAELRAAAERVAAARDDAAAWRATSEALRERFDKARKAARTYKRELHAARGLGRPSLLARTASTIMVTTWRPSRRRWSRRGVIEMKVWPTRRGNGRPYSWSCSARRKK